MSELILYMSKEALRDIWYDTLSIFDQLEMKMLNTTWQEKLGMYKIQVKSNLPLVDGDIISLQVIKGSFTLYVVRHSSDQYKIVKTVLKDYCSID